MCSVFNDANVHWNLCVEHFHAVICALVVSFKCQLPGGLPSGRIGATGDKENTHHSRQRGDTIKQTIATCDFFFVRISCARADKSTGPLQCCPHGPWSSTLLSYRNIAIANRFKLEYCHLHWCTFALRFSCSIGCASKIYSDAWMRWTWLRALVRLC